MADFPKSITIHEEGPREGFQIERGPDTDRTQDRVHRSAGGDRTASTYRSSSFVNPKKVPGMADADDVVRGFQPKPGVAYTGAVAQRKRAGACAGDRQAHARRQDLDLRVREILDAQQQPHDARRNSSTRAACSTATTSTAFRSSADPYRVAFGCNFQGDIPRLDRARHSAPHLRDRRRARHRR